MIVCPEYSTFCWWQEFCIIILAEKHKVLNLVFYISTHTPCTMESEHQKSLPNYFAICMCNLLHAHIPSLFNLGEGGFCVFTDRGR